MKRALLLSVLLAFGLAGVGCASHPTYAYVRIPPPAPRIEAYGYAPGPGYVWVDGYWGYRGSRYAWTPGYWARPPRRHAAWVSGRWMSTPRGYYWQPGYWR